MQYACEKLYRTRFVTYKCVLLKNGSYFKILLLSRLVNFLATLQYYGGVRIDAAYCYQPSVDLTVVSTAKTAQPIKMPFGLRTLVGPRNRVLDGSSDPPMGRFPMGRGNYKGEGGRLQSIATLCRELCKNG